MTTNSVSGLTMTLTAEGDVLAGAKNISITFTQSEIDVTSADSSRKGEYLGGRRDVVIDVDALYIYNDVAKKVLQNHLLQASPATVTCIITMPDGASYTGEGIVTSLSYSGPYEDALGMAASIKITDGITESTS
jgi:predicted secreted protein